MRFTLVVHILAGSLAMIFGYVALYAAKGGTLHRRTGRLFLYAMLVMAVGGILVAIGRGVAPGINLPAGLLSATLVITAFTAVRPLPRERRWVDAGAMLVALVVGITSLALGTEALATGGRRGGSRPSPTSCSASSGCCRARETSG